MSGLFQWCEYCKDNKVFDFTSVTCKTCGNKSKNFLRMSIFIHNFVKNNYI